MTGQDSEIRTLRRVVNEIQEQPAPRVDWDVVEQGLLTRIGREAPEVPRHGSWRFRVAGLAAAAAVILGAGLGTLRELDTPANPALTASSSDESAPRRIDGDRLTLGQRIVAGTTPVVVEHAGRASWTLKAHSNAWLAERGERITVRLEFGSVVASVVPSELAESFAVEAGRTRVAVHGTVFSVELLGDHAQVEVQQGTVSVRDTDGRDQGWLLTAPASGRFTLEGRRLDTLELPARPATTARRSAGQASPSAAQQAQSVAAQPDAAELELAADKVGDVVRRCFAEATVTPGAVHVSASSTMTVRFAADGRLEQLGFDPPLAPSVQSCSEAGVSGISVGRSRTGAAVSRVVHLG